MAARGFKRVLRWFPRSSAGALLQDEDEDSSERNGLLRSHKDQIVPVPVADFGEGSKALAVHVEPQVMDHSKHLPSSLLISPSRSAASGTAQTVALKVSMHCHGCARKVEKQVAKLQGVESFRVELESKKVTVVGNVSPAEVLESVCKVMKHAELLAAPC